ncbi:MAG: tRNA-dihydrouridine synthase family protein [Eubacteriales bacterium]|nr:tRNA-dihydrouridine synthase family protein [Eubacteriales bacterium]
MRYYVAPMEGVTGAVYRRTHHEFFPGADKYFMPFLTPTAQPKLTPRQLREVAPENNAGVPAVPQLLSRTAADCIWAIEALAALGYPQVDLNLGCPSGTVTAKGKGAGLLADPDALDRLLDAVYAASPIPVSIKTRLGMADPAEFDRLLAIYDRYPVAELTIHPRVRQDFYKGQVREGAFAAALPRCTMPVCYNGDLVSEQDVHAVETRYPAVQAVMIGRGLIADPGLIARLRGAPRAGRDTLAAFHDTLYERYCTQFGDRRVAVQRMKEVWSYHLHLFDDHEKHGKRLRKSRTADEYEQAAAAVFRDLELRAQPVPAWFRPA